MARNEPRKTGIWPRFLAFPVLAVLLHALLIIWWEDLSWLGRALLILGDSYCWFCVSGSFHEAAHQTLFSSELANLRFGRALGLMLGIPYTVYREAHRRHHAYLNTPADFELWPYSSPGASLTFRRVFVWLDVVFGMLTAPWIYGRIYFVSPELINATARRRIAREYAVLVGVWGLVITVIAAMTYQGVINWSAFNPLWLLPTAISGSLNTVRKLVEHIGMTSIDPMLGTRTILGRNLLSRVSSYLNFDIAIHGPHHRYPRAQHHELPSKLHELEQHAFAGTPLHVFPSYLSALPEVFRCSWRCPGVGEVALSDLQRTAPQTALSLQYDAPLEPDDWDAVLTANVTNKQSPVRETPLGDAA